MKKLLFVLAFATSVGVVAAQTQQPKTAVKKEDCCKKMETQKVAQKMACDKDSKMACCQKKMAETKKVAPKKS